MLNILTFIRIFLIFYKIYDELKLDKKLKEFNEEKIQAAISKAMTATLQNLSQDSLDANSLDDLQDTQAANDKVTLQPHD